MGETDGIEVMADALLKAHEAVKKHGTPEMQALIRLLLFQIGQEIVRARSEPEEARR